MIPQRVPNPALELVTGERLCGIARRWGARVELVMKVVAAAARLPFELIIFSGARSREHQASLGKEGRPATAFDLSTHADHDSRGCRRLATGVDVQPSSTAVRLDRSARAAFGQAMTLEGLRWGGGSPLDDYGEPQDVWHVDLGPRSTHP